MYDLNSIRDVFAISRGRIKTIKDPIALAIYALVEARYADAWDMRREDKPESISITLTTEEICEHFGITREQAENAEAYLMGSGALGDPSEFKPNDVVPCKTCHSTDPDDEHPLGICASCSLIIARYYYVRNGVPPESYSYQRDASKPKRKPISHSRRMKVFERDGFACKNCGIQKDLTVDHIVPFSKGGECAMDNYQTLCKSCNSSKGARTEITEGLTE